MPFDPGVRGPSLHAVACREADCARRRGATVGLSIVEHYNVLNYSSEHSSGLILITIIMVIRVDPLIPPMAGTQE